MPIYDPGLDNLVTHYSSAARLSFTTYLAEAVGEADVVLLAVGTPNRRGDGHADSSYIFGAVAEIVNTSTASRSL